MSAETEQPKQKKIRIGDALVAQGAINAEQLTRALAQQKATGRMLGELLVEQGVISPATLVSLLGKTLGVPSVQFGCGNLQGAEFGRLSRSIPTFVSS
jgi:hypothetical protein